MTTGNKGLYVEPTLASMIHGGTKTVIIKDRYFSFLPDGMALVTTSPDKQDMALGLIKLNKPKSITIREFKQLRKFHKISDESRRKLWPNAQRLFAYYVKQYYGFKAAKNIDMAVHNDIAHIIRLSDSDNNIRVADFSATTMSDSKLKESFKQLCKHHLNKTRFTSEEITLLGRKMMREMMKRNIKFNRNSSPVIKKLLNKLTDEKEFYVKPTGKAMGASDGENYSTALEYDLSDIKVMDGFRQIEHAEATEQGGEQHTYDLYFASGEYWLADDGIIKWRSLKDVPHEAVEEWHRVTGLRLNLEDCAQFDVGYIVQDPEQPYKNAEAYILENVENCQWLKKGTDIPVFIPEPMLKEVEGWSLEDLRILKLGIPHEYKGFTILWDGKHIDIQSDDSKISTFSKRLIVIKKSFADGDKFMPGESVIYGPMSGGEWKYLPATIVEDGTGARAGQVKIKLEGKDIWTDRDNVNKKAGKQFTKSTIELDFIKPTKPYLDMAAHVSNEFFMLEDMKDFDYTNRIIEKKYDGQRMQCHKRGNSVKFYTAYGNQISLNKLGNIPNEIRAINSHAFVLDGELIIPDSDRDVVHEAVTTIGSNLLEYRVFDILQVNDSRLIDTPLFRRRQILERLHSSPHVKVSPALKVTKHNIQGFLKQMKERGYEGAVIKDLNSKYQDRHAWHKFVFITNYLKETDSMREMSDHEAKDYNITLNRLERKLNEGKRIPITEQAMTEQKGILTQLLARDYSNPKFTLTRRFCWWYHPGKKKKRKKKLEDYHLKMECPSAYKFHLNKNPQSEDNIGAVPFIEGGKYFRPGEYAPGTDINPDEDKPAYIENICIGEFELIKEEPDMMEIRFNGRKLSGTFMFTRQDSAWTMTKITKQKQLSKLQFSFKDFRTNATPALAKDITFPYKRRTIAFAPGFWHHTVYTWDVIKESAMKMKGIPMVMEHSDEILDDLGNVTNVFINEQDQRIEVEFELLDTTNGKDAAIQLENNKIPAVSVSLEEWSDEIDGKTTCTQIVGFGHLALVKYPECAPAKICDKDGTCG